MILLTDNKKMRLSVILVVFTVVLVFGNIFHICLTELTSVSLYNVYGMPLRGGCQVAMRKA